MMSGGMEDWAMWKNETLEDKCAKDSGYKGLEQWARDVVNPDVVELDAGKASAALTKAVESAAKLIKQGVKEEQVNHPSHYCHGSIECIEALKSALTADEFRGYCKGNAIKYLWRTNHKGGTQDLQKANWYINKLAEDK